MTKEEEMYSILNELGIEKTILENTLSQPQEDLDKYPEDLLEQYKEELEMFKRTIDYIEKLQKENEELKKPKDNIQVVYGSRNYGKTNSIVKEYISKDKIREAKQYLEYYLIGNLEYENCQNEFKKILKLLEEE